MPRGSACFCVRLFIYLFLSFFMQGRENIGGGAGMLVELMNIHAECPKGIIQSST